ncbi:hypothetical protein H257_13724 [Aphanomyces astaci]|uniref:Uncharacterized protein n=1 Tax=Aphanomyces astaci TaxID=112090 RepID=W4FVZ8_APHAT|nr:hypothetical protein H257_13724 [Aphanomyces astaci]ETV70994.1 hypothetical protein H257_13724 [Aphanomyces astaci]|eukprot:XP_009839657.1 hypothetical protein H257_13724 [Aphanomyces astaci]
MLVFQKRSRSAPPPSTTLTPSWPFFSSSMSVYTTALRPCCAERERLQRRPSLFAKSHEVVAVRVVEKSPWASRANAACMSVVGGRVGIPMEADEVASQRRLYRRHIDHTMHTIQEENGSDACGDCHAYLYRPDVIVSVTNVHMAPRRRPPFQNAERYTKASTTRAPTAAGMNSPTTRKAKKLPMQLNQLARPSKNAFANFPKRQSPRM